MLVLISGGSGSGKSQYAEGEILALGDRRRIYIATMRPWDRECERRILRHHELRAGKGFETVECYDHLDQVDPGDVKQPTAVLLECMSNLVSNEMFGIDGTFSIENSKNVVDSVIRGICHLKNKADDLMIVTNDVFSDGITYDPVTVEYQRILGEINRIVAKMADRVIEVTVGIPIVVKDIR